MYFKKKKQQRLSWRCFKIYDIDNDEPYFFPPSKFVSQLIWLKSLSWLAKWESLLSRTWDRKHSFLIKMNYRTTFLSWHC